MERHQRLAGGEERGGIGARRSLLAQRHDRKEAKETHGDEDAFDDSSRDVAEHEDFVLPPENRVKHDGGADVGDNEDELQERSKDHAVVGGAGTEDVAGVLKHGGVEKEKRGDRGGKSDQVQNAKNSCDRLRMIDLNSFP